jgi:hypothetical protein
MVWIALIVAAVVYCTLWDKYYDPVQDLMPDAPPPEDE